MPVILTRSDCPKNRRLKFESIFNTWKDWIVIFLFKLYIYLLYLPVSTLTVQNNTPDGEIMTEWHQILQFIYFCISVQMTQKILIAIVPVFVG